MSKTKAEIIEDLVEKIALDMEDETTAGQYFDDVVERMSLLPQPPFIKTATVNMVDTQATYDYETDMLKLIHALLQGKLLLPATESQLDAYAYEWPGDADATPLAHYSDWLARQYSLYPPPNFNSGDTLRIFYSEDRASGIQDYYALPIALYILEREFNYSNIHQDTEFATQCGRLADLIMGVLKHDGISRNKDSSRSNRG